MEQSFGFTSIAQKLVNNSTGYIEYSYDGITFADKLFANQSTVLDIKANTSIWARSETPGLEYQIKTW